MEAPRTLGKTADGQVCELDDVACAYVLIGKGQTLVDHDPVAQQIDAYLKSKVGKAETKEYVQAEALMAEQAAPADAPDTKAVAQEETEDKGVHFPPDARRLGGGRK